MPDHRPDPLPACAAFGCGHPAQTAASSYCVSHTGLIWRFHRWLQGDPGHDVLSFERDFAGLVGGRWHPV